MENKEFLWIHNNPSSIEFKWASSPFSTTTSIIWRGILINIEIKDKIINYGSETTYTFSIGNQKHVFGMAKWKWTGGAFGKKPEIKNTTNSLTIIGGLKYIALIDVPLNLSETIYMGSDPIFEEKLRIVKDNYIPNHQAMLTKLMEKGYSKLTDEEKLYWRSVY